MSAAAQDNRPRNLACSQQVQHARLKCMQYQEVLESSLTKTACTAHAQQWNHNGPVVIGEAAPS
jgi:hypothetical protein